MGCGLPGQGNKMSCSQLGSLSISPSSVCFAAWLSPHRGFFCCFKQGYSLFGVHCPLAFLMLTDFLVPPGQEQFNVNNDEVVSNLRPNCNLVYWFQILKKMFLRPFFHFFPPIQGESCMTPKMLSWPSNTGHDRFSKKLYFHLDEVKN